MVRTDIEGTVIDLALSEVNPDDNDRYYCYYYDGVDDFTGVVTINQNKDRVVWKLPESMRHASFKTDRMQSILAALNGVVITAAYELYKNR